VISRDTVRQMIDERVGWLRARLRGAIVRGVLKVLDDSKGLQRGQVKLLADEVSEEVEFLSPPGFTSRPAAGAEVVVLSIGGDPSHRVALVVDRRTRLAGELAEGEAALHIGVAGQVVRLKANGDVVITPGGVAGKVLLGDDAATLLVALAAKVQARLDGLKAAMGAGWVVVPNDGGAALKTALATWLLEDNDVASDNVYGKGTL
jgi:phage baseplate assembly protein V